MDYIVVQEIGTMRYMDYIAVREIGTRLYYELYCSTRNKNEAIL